MKRRLTQNAVARITYVEHNGREHVVDVPNGLTVMEAIRDNGFDELLALCGGTLLRAHR